MPSSGLQLLGFSLALAGLAATIAATFMVEWKHFDDGKNAIRQTYEGLWVTCISNINGVTCEEHDSLLELADDIQVTRAVMLVGIFLSSVAVLVSTVGMKCTRFLDGDNKTKSTVAMVGGITFMISGLLTLTITCWYVGVIVNSFYDSPQQKNRSEFGSAVFVSWAGAILTLMGGAFLSCRRCSSRATVVSTPKPRPVPCTKSDYV